jgi:hypothetical protein
MLTSQLIKDFISTSVAVGIANNLEIGEIKLITIVNNSTTDIRSELVCRKLTRKNKIA